MCDQIRDGNGRIYSRMIRIIYENRGSFRDGINVQGSHFLCHVEEQGHSLRFNGIEFMGGGVDVVCADHTDGTRHLTGRVHGNFAHIDQGGCDQIGRMVIDIDGRAWRSAVDLEPGRLLPRR